MPATRIRTQLRATALQADEIFYADTDLSAACAVNRFVSQASTVGYVQLANGACNPTPLGVLVTGAPAGSQVRVRVFGRVTLTACPGGSALATGGFISSACHGYALASGCAIVLGRWLSASMAANASPASGTAFINCITPGSALGTGGAS